MKFLKGLACIITVAGIGIILSGQLTNLGIVLLLEGGVLFTLLKKDAK
jgi:hypothetical protein